MNIELLYFDGCPSHVQAEDILRQALEETHSQAEIEKIDITDEQMAIDLRFLGSPSIRINGIDVDPVARDSTSFSRKCRIYQTDEGIRGWPSKKMVTETIHEAQK